MKLQYRHTKVACYFGYITQAIVNNLPPLLFLTFQNEFGLSLSMVTMLITVNFVVQLLVDLASMFFIDRIGYRASAFLAHTLGFVGLVGLGIFPYILPNPFVGLLIATIINAIGGGLIEVIISPIVEAIPEDGKAASMSFLHSFYCWGVVTVVILSTLFFGIAGTEHWRFLPALWGLIPLLNAFFFLRVPLAPLISENEKAMPLRRLFTRKAFLLLFVLMLCAGAAEVAMSQWASLFAESGLQVSKTMGDLMGPCMFALMMGVARLFFGRKNSRFTIEQSLLGSAVLCVFSYLLVSLSPFPVLSLIGCALCGLSVGVMWPGTFSLAAKSFPQGGTAMFAILALAGDVGCASGPGLVGIVSNAVEGGSLPFFSRLFEGQLLEQVSIKSGLLFGIIFPVLLMLALILMWKEFKSEKTEEPVKE